MGDLVTLPGSIERHTWLEKARVECARLLGEVGCNVPDRVRITIGFPSVGGRGKRIGECWSPEACSDAWAEIFISPKLSDSVQIMATLAHELIHAAVGNDAKHGPDFKKPALAVGLEGKMTATVCGERLRGTFETWLSEHGPYPAGALRLDTRKKQGTRMLKAQCPFCGYTARLTAKWVEEVGPPHCPNDGAMEMV